MISKTVNGMRRVVTIAALCCLPALTGCEQLGQASTDCKIGLMKSFTDLASSAIALAKRDPSLATSSADPSSCSDG